MGCIIRMGFGRVKVAIVYVCALAAWNWGR